VTTGDPYLVETLTGRPGAVWDELVQRSDAPLFYRSAVLRAYHRHPLREPLRIHYLAVRERATGRAAAVLPAYLLPAEDPLRVLADMVPGFDPDGRPVLLSHVWHWYDTWVPARRLTAALLDGVCRALASLAADAAAQAFGLVNVEQGSALAAALAATGRQAIAIDARYTLDLRPYRDVGDYLATLSRKARQDIRRHLRLADKAGAEVTVRAPDEATMRQAAELCVATSAKHGNRSWYRPEALAGFVCSLPGQARLVTIRIGGEPVAVSISFVDGQRFHNWTAGSAELSSLPFSPYLVLLHATVSAAIAEGCALLEGGRRNDEWKLRLNFTRRPLLGWAVRPAGRNPRSG
jgi:CelD/BcsL family acetyltransferase involved in cellulose biosynthesis